MKKKKFIEDEDEIIPDAFDEEEEFDDFVENEDGGSCE